jgi:hypothetical protein
MFEIEPWMSAYIELACVYYLIAYKKVNQICQCNDKQGAELALKMLFIKYSADNTMPNIIFI